MKSTTIILVVESENNETEAVIAYKVASTLRAANVKIDNTFLKVVPEKSAVANNYIVKSIGANQIALERRFQIQKHSDDGERHPNGELTQMARALLKFPTEHNENHIGDQRQMLHQCPISWDNTKCLKLVCMPYRERLRIAGALIAAEIDRLAENDKAPY